MKTKKLTTEDVISQLLGMGIAIPNQCVVRWNKDSVSISWDPDAVEWDENGRPTNLWESSEKTRTVKAW
ncbi:MAG TPA: hypothetical protein VM487_13940 [Phycisphaerae bacterium]|nr:hypothetical protein [Phycisphaerae bacterium]